LIEGIIALTGASLLDEIKALPQVAAVPGAYEAIVEAGKLAYTLAYRYVYYASIGTQGRFPILHLRHVANLTCSFWWHLNHHSVLPR
jgi:hypothetical protein